MTPPEAETERPWEEDFLAGCALAVVLGCIAMAERLEVAAGTVASIRAAGGEAANAPSLPGTLWLLPLVVGGVVAFFVVRHLIKEAEKHNVKINALPLLAYSALGAWVGWLALRVFGFLPPVGTGLHWLAIVLGLVAIVGAGGATVDLKHAWKHGSAVRIQLIVLAALFAVVFVVPITAAQSIDVLRGWGDGSWTQAATGLAAALLLGAVGRASATRLLLRGDEPGKRWKRSVTIVAALLGGLAIVGALFGAYLGAGVAVVVGFAAWLTVWAVPPHATEVEKREWKIRSWRLIGTLGVVPLMLVYAGLVSASVDSYLLVGPLQPADEVLFWFTAVVGLVLGALAGDAHRRRGVASLPMKAGWAIGVAGFVTALLAAVGPTVVAGTFDVLWTVPLLALTGLLATRVLGESGAVELAAAAGIVLGTATGVYLDPIGVPVALGAFGLALIGTAGILLALHALATVGARRAPKWHPGGLPESVRVPVVLLLAAWLVIAFVWREPTFHQAATLDGSPPDRSLEKEVQEWLDREVTDGSDYVPMMLVAASGGGSKAAYWTALVLDCVLGEDTASEANGYECPPSDNGDRRLGRLFLTSSVSGGSVGIYHFALRAERFAAGTPWVEPTAGREVLSPLTAWGLFHDFPAFLVRARIDPRLCEDKWTCRVHADRALVQEAAVANFPDQGIVPPPDSRLLSEREGGPITIFNAAHDGGEARVLISPLGLAPPRSSDPRCTTLATGEPAGGSIDAHDVLDGEDVRLATAALLSARFPVLAPAAHVGDDRDGEDEGCNAVPLPPVHVRDGGYIENTGLLTIAELLTPIRAAIDDWKKDEESDVHVQLIVVSIDDDATVLDADPARQEAGRKMLGVSARAGPGYLTRLARDRITSCQYPGVSYLRLSPPPRVGVQAATGWELSRTARRQDLVAAVGDDDVSDGIATLRAVLDGENDLMACGSAAEPEP